MVNYLQKVIADHGPEEISPKPLKITTTKKTKTKQTHETVMNILNPKQMFQRLSIALAHVNTGNISENVLKETCQMIPKDSLNYIKHCFDVIYVTPIFWLFFDKLMVFHFTKHFNRSGEKIEAMKK